MIALIPTLTAVAALIAQAVGAPGTPPDLPAGAEGKAPAYSQLSSGGHCQGGGRVTLTVTKLETTYHVRAELRGVDAGRWRGSIEEDSGTRPYRFDGVDFDVRTTNGRVTVEGEVRQLVQPVFSVIALGPGKLDLMKGRHCIATVAGDPLTALAGCRSKGFKLAMVQTFRRDGGSVVRWWVGQVARQSSWTVEITAETDTDGAGVGGSVAPNRHGLLHGKEFFAGMVNPRIRLVATSKGGQVCTVQTSRALAPPPA